MEVKFLPCLRWGLIILIVALSACSSSTPSPQTEDITIDNLAVENWFGDNDPGVQYSQDWSYVKASQYADGDSHVSTSSSANLTFHFSGTSLKLYASKSKNAGKFKVYIDGAYKQEVDLYSSWLSPLYNQQVFYSSLTPGTHSVKIVHSATKNLFSKGYDINLDRIKIAGRLFSAPASLKTVSVPSVANLSNYIVDKSAAVVLGKAFFWDMAAGSDGQACASCHFHAGTDNRIKNQISPGLNAGDTSFQTTASGGKGGPNYTLKLADFPLHKFSDPANPYSSVLFSTNDTISSQGVFLADFQALPDSSALDDLCSNLNDGIFHVGSSNTRQVEPRNTPTMINAALNFRNFWDGRANNVFNGVDPFGKRNSAAKIMTYNGSKISYETLDLRNSALASQATGPAVSTLEMACVNRKFADLGKKLIVRQPLAFQQVHAQDSVLASYRNSSGKGLNTTYRALIQKAFNSKYWNAPGDYSGYSQMENNFSLFWGLALQAYQDTLISDETPYDDYAEGNKGALSDAAKRGLDIFIGKGHCISCHSGSEFTSAATSQQKENEEGGLIERMYMGNGKLAIYDRAFYNIGVTPTNQDLGVGAKDPFGNPLSFSKQYIDSKFVDPIKVNPCTFDVPFSSLLCSYSPLFSLKYEKIAVDGAFKVPGLRNATLTGPYFHNGSAASLEQVVEFYNRGGNFRNNPELDPDIQPLGLSASERADLVAFLVSLTDPRVENEAAPFDHPQLFIPNGHEGNEYSVTQDEQHRAKTDWLEVPAIGKYGRSSEGLADLKDFVWTLKNGGPDLKKASLPSNTPQPEPSPNPSVKNILLNGDFEAGLSGWASGDTTVSLSADAAQGSSALQMTAWGWLQQDIQAADLVVGKTYTLSVKGKSISGQSCTVGFSGAGFSVSLSFSSSSYSQKSLAQLLPAGADWGAVYFTSEAGTCLFDEVILSSK
ncbi:MAG: carbohydrate binding domain-containing protein [Trueperaceae bacterium]|nr:carbohydrate binding domain-containing protein [Trueperaceae bacterium]